MKSLVESDLAMVQMDEKIKEQLVIFIIHRKIHKCILQTNAYKTKIG